MTRVAGLAIEAGAIMARSWRTWVLAVLLVGPILVYIGLGSLWLVQHRGPLGLKGELLYYGMTLWVLSGVAFAVLANRWTKDQRAVLPPLDWEAPETFTPRDRTAWELVEAEAIRSDELSQESLVSFDTYIDTGRGLARRLATHYRPKADDPIEDVPVVELLTAFQLAAEDLNILVRQVPGGDLLTPSHYKTAMVATRYITKANELYNFLLPLFQPVAGLARLGAQKLMVQPAWKNMQQNLLRWFFRAYVNRLGIHLIELYSGRLVVGSDAYRRLARKAGRRLGGGGVEDTGPWTLAVAGAKGAGKSVTIQALRQIAGEQVEAVRRAVMEQGAEPGLAERLRDAQLVEVAAYEPTAVPAEEEGRWVRRAREAAVAAASEADLLVLVIDARRSELESDRRFLTGWRDELVARPGQEVPPVLVVLTHVDAPEMGTGDWSPPYRWTAGGRDRELAVRTRAEQVRATLPVPVAAIVPLSLRPGDEWGIPEELLPAVAGLSRRTERVSILRHLNRLAGRSSARRVLGQIGAHGRSLWGSIRSGRGRERSAS
jgi:predicted GTPase